MKLDPERHEAVRQQPCDGNQGEVAIADALSSESGRAFLRCRTWVIGVMTFFAAKSDQAIFFGFQLTENQFRLLYSFFLLD
jgi:hypothetical protein